MDLFKKLNLTVSSTAGIRVDYLKADLATVESTIIIPIFELKTIMFDPSGRLSPNSTVATEGDIMFDRKWDTPKWNWVVSFCDIINYNGSAIGATTFANIQTAVLALIEPEGSGLAFGKYGSTIVLTPGASGAGTWFAIHALSDAVFTSITDATMTGTTTSAPLAKGDTIYGNFTAFTTSSGSVIAYKK